MTHDVRFLGQRAKNSFPTSFPHKASYDRGFGFSIDFSVKKGDGLSMFGDVTWLGLGWFDDAQHPVELLGEPFPGTMLVKRPSSASGGGRIGMVIGVTSHVKKVLNVMWAPETVP